MTYVNGPDPAFQSDETTERQNEYDKILGRVLGVFICIDIVNLTIKQTKILPSGGLSYILGVLFILYVLYERRRLFAGNGFLKLLCAEGIFALLVLITCIRFREAGKDIVSRCIYTAMFCIPLYVFSQRVTNKHLAIQQTIVPSIAVLILSGFVYLYFRGHADDGSYNITIGYALLYPAAVFWVCRNQKRRYLVLFIISALLIFVIGSRGPMLCLLVLVALEELSNWRGMTAKELIFKTTLLVLLLLVILLFKEIIQLISGILGNFGIYSRSLTMILNGIITSDSGRSTVFDLAKEALQFNPFLGYGIAGDIAVLGFYPHNLFLELCFHFGYPIGILLSAVICLKVIINLKQGETFERNAYFVFLSCGLIPLLISGTYLQTPLFWVLMGLCRWKIRQ